MSTEADSARKANERRFLIAVLIVGGVWTLALVRLLGLVSAGASNVPFQDQWALLTPTFDRTGAWSAFTWQHGPHRQGVGGLLQYFLYPASGYDVRAEGWAAAAVLGLAGLVAVVLSARLRGRLSWADAVFPLLIVNPVHWETMLLTPNIAHGILPLLLALLLACCWARDRGPLPVVGVAVVTGLSLFTGFGFATAFASAGLIGLLLVSPVASGWSRARLAAVAVAFAVALGVFAIGYRWDPAVPGWRFPVPEWWNYPKFCAYMHGSLLGVREVSATALVLGSVLCLAVCVAWLWSLVRIVRGSADARTRVVALLGGAGLSFAVFTAIGRLPVNIQAAFMWRYLPLLVPGVCALILAAEACKPRLGRAGPWLVDCAAVALAGWIWMNFVPEGYSDAVARGKERWIEAYRATRDLSRANADAEFDVLSSDPESELVRRRLQWMEREHLGFMREP